MSSAGSERKASKSARRAIFAEVPAGYIGMMPIESLRKRMTGVGTGSFWLDGDDSDKSEKYDLDLLLEAAL